MAKALGIIGCGAVTQNSYVKALSMYADVQPQYVFDINQDLANQVAQMLGAKPVTKEELLSKSDIVVIATPPSTHFSLVKEALRPGIKVICEKPFVGTVDEAEQLIHLAKENNCELYVAHFRRTYPSVELARSIVSSGVLGKLTKLEAYEGGRFSWKTQSGYVYKDPYGGVLFDTGSHTLDMTLYMAGLDTGKINIVPVEIEKDKEEPAHHIKASLKLETAELDVHFNIVLSRKLLLANKIRITGENGFIDVSVGMTSYIRLSGSNGSTVLYSNVAYEDISDCFAIQFKDMFYDSKDSKFTASRYVNLTLLLETISQAKINIYA